MTGRNFGYQGRQGGRQESWSCSSQHFGKFREHSGERHAVVSGTSQRSVGGLGALLLKDGVREVKNHAKNFPRLPAEFRALVFGRELAPDLDAHRTGEVLRLALHRAPLLRAINRHAEVYETDGAGRIVAPPLQTYSPLGDRATWTHVIPGLFGESGFTGILLYDCYGRGCMESFASSRSRPVLYRFFPLRFERDESAADACCGSRNHAHHAADRMSIGDLAGNEEAIGKAQARDEWPHLDALFAKRGHQHRIGHRHAEAARRELAGRCA
jgi:hypothetical protein